MTLWSLRRNDRFHQYSEQEVYRVYSARCDANYLFDLNVLSIVHNTNAMANNLEEIKQFLGSNIGHLITFVPACPLTSSGLWNFSLWLRKSIAIMLYVCMKLTNIIENIIEFVSFHNKFVR